MWKSSMLQGTFFILVESMADKYRKAVYLMKMRWVDEQNLVIQ